MKRTTFLYILIAAVMVALVGMVIYLVNRVSSTEAEMQEMVEQMTYEKEQLEAEYADVAIEMEGISINVKNDSLLTLIEREQQKVKMLQEELRMVKATNARRIAELKAELASVRKVLVYYVAQVDSLSRVNSVLERENQTVTRRYNEAAEQVQSLTEEREMLTEKITIASKLDVQNIVVETQNKKGHKRNSVKNVDIIKVSYTIPKNVTTEPGNKTVYLRVATPDNSVLHKNESDLFEFENSAILYSSRKHFEYAGEALNDVIYYTITETLFAGTYRADLFVDGNLVGSQEFILKK